MSNIIKKEIFSQKQKYSEQKVVRMYHKNQKYLTNKTVINSYNKLKGQLKTNQRLMIRAMTEYGLRTLAGFNDEELRFQTTEEYIDGTQASEAKPYRRLSYIDVYVVSNILRDGGSSE